MNIQEERTAFYFELGLAITHWAHVEHLLADLVMAAVDAQEQSILATAMASIESFRARLQFVDSVLQTRLATDADRSAKWRKLERRIDGLSRSRNALAHGWACGLPMGRPGRRQVLTPLRPRQKGPTSPPPSGSLGVRDIVRIRLEFVAGITALATFAAVLRGGREPAKPDGLPVIVPSLVNIRADLYHFIGWRGPKPPPEY